MAAGGRPTPLATPADMDTELNIECFVFFKQNPLLLVRAAGEALPLGLCVRRASTKACGGAAR